MATSKFIVRFNKAQAGIEVVIPDGRRLSGEEIEILKSMGFAWHRKNHYYYTKYTDEKMKLIKECFIGKDAQLPSKTETKVIAEMAAAAAAQRAKEKKERPAKKETSVERMNRLEDMMVKMMEMMTAQAAANLVVSIPKR